MSERDNQQDQSGTKFQTQDNKEPVYGQDVKILTGNGTTTSGTWNGTHAVPNKSDD